MTHVHHSPAGEKFQPPPLPASRWRLCLTPALSGAENMALDVALMERARQTGEAVFRVYSWRAPTLSLGRHQTARNKYDLTRIAELGADVVRRPTGGRAILHWHEVTYSVTAPATDVVSLRDSYTRINQILLTALTGLGVDAHLAQPTTRPVRPTNLPCFAEPSQGEMTAGGQKLVGSAQWRDNGALLQHGSILVDDDQTLLASLSTDLPDTAVPPPATLSGLLGEAPPIEHVATALFDAVKAMEDPDAEDLSLDEILRTTPPPIDDFLNPEWTWRR